MKTYFLALINTDFTITGNKWVSSPFDLYANRFYTNYSNYRNIYGLNLLEDYTFTGNQILPDATPTILGKYATDYITDAGEVIKDLTFGEYYIFDYDSESSPYYLFNLLNSSTPFQILSPSSTQFLQRFIDTSSPINILRIQAFFYQSSRIRRTKFFCKDIYIRK